MKTTRSLPPANYAAKAAAEGVTLQAQAITDEDFLYDIFDANLISAGILPVRVMLTNSGGEPVHLKSARFEIRARGGRFEAISAKKAFKRLISYYEISAYTKSGYKESVDGFLGYAFDTNTPLPAGQSRQGLLFFLVPSDAARGASLTMVVSKLGGRQSESRTGLELVLNQ